MLCDSLTIVSQPKCRVRMPNMKKTITLPVAVKMLRATGTRHVNGHFWRRLFLDHATLVKSSWLNGNSQWNPEAPVLKDETTYERCVDAQLAAVDDRLTLKLVLYDGDLLDGQRTQRRCEFVGYFTSLPDALVPYIESVFDMLIEQGVEQAEAERLAELRKRVESRLTLDYFG